MAISFAHEFGETPLSIEARKNVLLVVHMAELTKHSCPQFWRTVSTQKAVMLAPMRPSPEWFREASYWSTDWSWCLRRVIGPAWILLTTLQSSNQTKWRSRDYFLKPYFIQYIFFKTPCLFMLNSQPRKWWFFRALFWSSTVALSAVIAWAEDQNLETDDVTYNTAICNLWQDVQWHVVWHDVCWYRPKNTLCEDSFIKATWYIIPMARVALRVLSCRFSNPCDKPYNRQSDFGLLRPPTAALSSMKNCAEASLSQGALSSRDSIRFRLVCFNEIAREV